MAGDISTDLNDKLEAKIRSALCPRNPRSDKATKMLKDFLKPDNRSFDKFVAKLKIIPKEQVDQQIDLYFSKSSKTNH